MDCPSTIRLLSCDGCGALFEANYIVAALERDPVNWEYTVNRVYCSVKCCPSERLSLLGYAGYIRKVLQR